MLQTTPKLFTSRSSFSCVTDFILDIDDYYKDIPDTLESVDLSSCSMVLLDKDNYVLMEWSDWVADSVYKNSITVSLAARDQWDSDLEYDYIRLLSDNDELSTLDKDKIKDFYERGLLRSLHFSGVFCSIGEPKRYSGKKALLNIRGNPWDIIPGYDGSSVAIIDSEDTIIMSTNWFCLSSNGK